MKNSFDHIMCQGTQALDILEGQLNAGNLFFFQWSGYCMSLFIQDEKAISNKNSESVLFLLPDHFSIGEFELKTLWNFFHWRASRAVLLFGFYIRFSLRFEWQRFTLFFWVILKSNIKRCIACFFPLDKVEEIEQFV